jgi:tRNA A58 N-methylase Trm61
LYQKGWIKSLKLKKAVDNRGNPIPWWSYSFISFLNSRIKKDFKILEYGSGHSTLWLENKVKKVISIEHNKDWKRYIEKSLKTDKIKIVLKEQDYVNLDIDEKFDIVIVDGVNRNECLVKSVNFLKNDGVIILDDAEREEYKKGIEFVLNKGFKKLDFVGLAPGIGYEKNTCVFYRPKNCLGI